MPVLRQRRIREPANSPVKLARPVFGPAAEPPWSIRIRRAARRPHPFARRGCGARVARGAPLGFGTWALTVQLTGRTLAGPKTH